MNRSPLWSATCACAVLALVSLIAGCGGGGGGGNGGGKIAFTSFRDGNEEIYVMNSDGSGQANLTNNAAGDQFPSFSADGSKIAFASDRDGFNNAIYVMNSDGSAATNLTNNAAMDLYPSFGP